MRRHRVAIQHHFPAVLHVEPSRGEQLREPAGGRSVLRRGQQRRLEETVAARGSHEGTCEISCNVEGVVEVGFQTEMKWISLICTNKCGVVGFFLATTLQILAQAKNSQNVTSCDDLHHYTVPLMTVGTPPRERLFFFKNRARSPDFGV